MVKSIAGSLILCVALISWNLSYKSAHTPAGGEADTLKPADEEWVWQTEQVADLRILRYQVPGFESLPLQQKELLYYLYEAALYGRDMIYDQNCKYNLTVRKTLEAILNTYAGEKSGKDWDAFVVYAKRFFFSNGIHHHYSNDKIETGFDAAYFAGLVRKSDPGSLPLNAGESVDAFIQRVQPVLFDPSIAPKRTNKKEGVDIIAGSANNFYEGVTQAEVEAYYKARINPADEKPVSWGLNSKLMKENGQLVEKVWKVGGMYDASIRQIVTWLEKASGVAETPQQKEALDLLVAYYRSGDLKLWDDYNVAWVFDTTSTIDVVNGFIEVYQDAKGFRASYESVVSVKDPVASKRIAAISKEAQWFEDHSPLLPNHKKDTVRGISAKVINVVIEAGDAAPATPIGINLPNSNWIREYYGSKSVNLGNIVQAYDESARSSGILDEFAYTPEEAELSRTYGSLADNLHTDMHEVIGHASGKLEPGVADPSETLKQYASTLEEARADLVALYYMYDQKLVDMGLMPSLDVGKEAYNDYLRNGLMLQLRRIKPGDDIEEDHMRNRQLVSKWVVEKGAPENVVEKLVRDGKTYFVIHDYAKLRVLFGDLLREIQRIKSQGDFNAARALVEGYGVKVDQAIHQEVLKRVEKLNIAPYAGFIQPRLVPVMEGGKLVDVKIEYPSDFLGQHLEYGRRYATLPAMN